MHARRAAAFRLAPLLSRFVPAPVAALIAPSLEALLALRQLGEFYAGLPAGAGPAGFCRAALAHLEVHFDLDGVPEDVPAVGPLVVVANHPFGGLEGLYLYALLAARRGDVRILGNQLLGRIEELAPVLFPVDVLGGRAVAARNAGAMRGAIRWVRDGGCLLVFPAGEVASFDPATQTIVDPAWHRSIGRIATLARAPALPVYVDGRNSALFHAAGLLHPRLRTALLPRELLNKRRRRIAVRLGPLVKAEALARLPGEDAVIEHLRLQVYALAARRAERAVRRRLALRQGARAPRPADAIAAPTPRELLAAEVAALPAAQRLGVNGSLEVWHARADAAPFVMQEIGRLRELTFRAVGEGTGRARDLDLYDSYYDQLFVWNSDTHELVGGYRIGRTDRILARFGVKGLYTSTLFRYHKALLPSLGNALELGRSFVRPEYQRGFAPLLLLWKGIAGYVLAHPEYRVLFGPVSISNDYSTASQALLTGFLRSHHGDARRARLARPRHPLPNTGSTRLMRREAAEASTLEAIEAVLTSIERDGKGVPVLLRQYLKLGAKAIAFNVDPAFAHSIDVLVAVDLATTEPKVLAKYMGAAGAERYLAVRR